MKKKLLCLGIMLAVACSMIFVPVTASASADALVIAKTTVSGSHAVKVTWNKTKGATKYVIYGAPCGKKQKKLKTVKGTSYTVKKISGKKLKAHAAYQFKVAAYSGNKKLAESRSMHLYTANYKGKYGNAKSITTKTKEITLTEGKTRKLSAAVKIYKGKKHMPASHGAKLTFRSGNRAVAKVNSKGVVTALKKGTATIYIQDIRGIHVKVKVTVQPAPKPAPAVVPTYKVVFDANGSEISVPAQTVKKGMKAAKPDLKAEKRYDILGWYKDQACTKAWDFNKDAVTGNVRLYAKWKANYLSFTAEEDHAAVTTERLKYCPVGIEYSENLKEWKDFTKDGVILEKKGDCIYMRAKGVCKEPLEFNFDISEGKVAAGGSIMSLLDGEMKTEKIPAPKEESDGAFKELFQFCHDLTAAPELPAEKLTKNCYYGMFENCDALKQAPELPAEELAEACYGYMLSRCYALEEAPELGAAELADGCYIGMFYDCSALKQAPELPAETLAMGCYQGMFEDCILLKQAPELAADVMTDYCYADMFNGCDALQRAPTLASETLAENCYSGMFYGCESLQQAPMLPAKTMEKECYQHMFSCSALEEAPELPATVLAENCYKSMFSYCSELKIAPELPAAELAGGCYENMFRDCTSLDSVTVAFTDWGSSGSTVGWLSGTAEKGTFICPAALEEKRGEDFIPAEWIVKNN